MTRRKKKKNEFAQFMKVTILIVFLLSALGMTINPATFVGYSFLFVLWHYYSFFYQRLL